MYKVVGVVKRQSKFCEPGAESRAVGLRLPERSSLDP